MAAVDTLGVTNSVLSERRPAVPPSLRTPMAVAALAGAWLTVALAALYIAGGRLWDSDGVEGPIIGLPWNPVAVAVDFLAEPIGAAIVVPALVIGCFVLGRRRLAVVAAMSSVLAVAATSAIKPLVGRPIHGEHFSYPSGHTALLTVLGLVFALLLVDLARPGRPAALAIMAAGPLLAGGAMAWSQTVLSAHYLTDTIGGFGTAIAAVGASAWLVDRIADRAA